MGYRFGQCVNQNEDKAIDLLQQAVQLGCKEAAYTLGMMYSSSDSRRRDSSKGKFLLRQAREAGIIVEDHSLPDVKEKVTSHFRSRCWDTSSRYASHSWSEARNRFLEVSLLTIR